MASNRDLNIRLGVQDGQRVLDELRKLARGDHDRIFRHRFGLNPAMQR